MATVALRNVSKRFGHVEALRTLSLDVASGEFVTLLGPSGCGKSTTLRIIAGLTAPDSGEVRIGDRDVTHLPTFRRRIGMVFQSLALFPHLTVGENIAFGLEMRKFEPGNETALVRRALETVRLSGYEERYPSQLSGGQQQRVALARAVVFNPDVVLLDEPLAALDRNLREAMQTELRELTRRIGITSIFVTHDQEEALILSDRIAVMNDGVIEQFGPPAEVFDAPKTRYVADFMGVVNFCEATVEEVAGGEAVLDARGFRVRARTVSGLSAGSRIHFAIRPERIILAESRPAAAVNAIECVVESHIFHGSISTYRVRLSGLEDVRLVARQVNLQREDYASPVAEGAKVWASFSPGAIYIILD